MRSMYVIQYPFFRYIKESILKNVISGVRCSGQYSVFCWRLAALWGERDNSAAAAVRASQVRENCCTGNFLSQSIKKSNQIREDLKNQNFQTAVLVQRRGKNVGLQVVCVQTISLTAMSIVVSRQQKANPAAFSGKTFVWKLN